MKQKLEIRDPLINSACLANTAHLPINNLQLQQRHRMLVQVPLCMQVEREWNSMTLSKLLSEMRVSRSTELKGEKSCRVTIFWRVCWLLAALDNNKQDSCFANVILIKKNFKRQWDRDHKRCTKGRFVESFQDSRAWTFNSIAQQILLHYELWAWNPWEPSMSM